MTNENTEQHGLANVLEHNIKTLYELQQQAAARRSLQDRIADGVTDFSGRMSFIYVHIAWFVIWFAVNTGKLGFPAFDPFPYELLTMVVSLEAIFLSTFVLLSQNRQSESAKSQSDLALQIGLLTEHEVTRVLQMLDAIQQRLAITDDKESELAQLELDTRPEDVLAEIKRVQRDLHRRKMLRLSANSAKAAADQNGAKNNN